MSGDAVATNVTNFQRFHEEWLELASKSSSEYVLGFPKADALRKSIESDGFLTAPGHTNGIALMFRFTLHWDAPTHFVLTFLESFSRILCPQMDDPRRFTSRNTKSPSVAEFMRHVWDNVFGVKIAKPNREQIKQWKDILTA
jgi:hypothetical protein